MFEISDTGNKSICIIIVYSNIAISNNENPSGANRNAESFTK